MTVRQKTVEKPAGRGHVRLANGQTVKVRYALVVLQTVILADEGAATGLPGGGFEVRGTIEFEPTHSRPDLTGQTLTLTTADRRCLLARVTSGDPPSGPWEIHAFCPNGLEPCR